MFNKVSLVLLSVLTIVCGCFPSAVVLAQEAERLGGHIQAQVNGESYIFPTLKSNIYADIQGDLATVTVSQTFVNPLNTPINATYLFPLNKDAAVYEMIMKVGDETVRAKIKRTEEARKTFERAKRQGRSASLLTQYRPNMYTQDIANLMPGLPIKVTLRYVQTIPKVEGDYQLVVPLVVGPRFQPPRADHGPDGPESPQSDDLLAPAQEGGVPRWHEENAGALTTAHSQAALGQWELEELPPYPPVSGLDIPEQVDAERVSITVALNSAIPVNYIKSSTHELQTEPVSGEKQKITLAKGRTIDNRDFILRYSLQGEHRQAGLLAYRDERGGFFSLMIEPPATPASEDISPREMVFVLDCSGSMSGLPMEASKAFMREALHALRPSDSFRIIRFSDSATEFSSRPLPATATNIRRGIRYTNGLRGSGGTMMTSGIQQALAPPVPQGAIRLVTFLTDGYIGNEAEVLRLIRQTIGPARLFAFGVGTGVNRYLLSEMGHMGRGFTRYMDPTEKVEEGARELAGRLQSPVLTDIEIGWGKLAPEQVTPEQVPDLFAGQSLRIQGRYTRPGTYNIKVHGRVNGRRATLPLRVNLPKRSPDGKAIALVWARSAIKESMRQLSLPVSMRKRGVADDQLKHQVTSLGLGFSLVTRWTSFVAVTDKVYNNNPQHTPTRPVPLPQVKGVSHLAYGPGNGGFSGHATPEPGPLMGLTLMAMLLGWKLKLWRRRSLV